VTSAPPRPRRAAHIDYRWIALSNTTLGILMASLNASTVLIALPAIFRGIGVNPLAPGETDYLLWMLVGYTLVLAVMLVPAGRISDMFGRVRLYNAGFAVFAAGSVACYLVPGSGNNAVLWLIGARMVQAVGGAFLMANSAAILTDAFPPDQRGFAMGVNQIAGLAGGFIGLLLGGVLAGIDWRAIFLVSVPFAIIGTVWAYLMLHETATIRRHQRFDVLGLVLFATGLTAVLVAFTFALQPYGDSAMGWTNPWVIGGVVGGTALLVAFVIVELRVQDPLFRVELFRIRRFAMGNIAGALSSIARGGLQLILIVWLQGIWLPQHGYAFDQTPLWAGVYMLPLTVGFLLSGPVSGALSDRMGTRVFATAGMLLSALGFIGLLMIPANFDYPVFAGLLLLLGVSQGVFAAPNTASVMNSVPAAFRGVASGMRAAFLNVGQSISLTVIFTLVVMGLSANLPTALVTSLTAAGVPAAMAAGLSHIPPIGALFAAFLGYNPMAMMLPPAQLAALPEATRTAILDTSFFPQLLSGPFVDGLRVAFTACAAVSLAAAAASWFDGPDPAVEALPHAPVAEAMLEAAVAEAVVEPEAG
jgi:MFS family permease